MNNIYCHTDDLKNESDIEQKFLLKLIETEFPEGLGYLFFDLHTKPYLKNVIIDKGKNQRNYVPDYLIVYRGLPVLIIEAKSPSEKVAQGFKEARLYATEINATFPHGISPCKHIISSNGNETWAGYWDQEEPVVKLHFSDFFVGNVKFDKLLTFCAKKSIVQYINEKIYSLRGNTQFTSPVSLVGGSRAKDEEMEENTYGRTLVFENHNIFDPQTEKDREEIVDNAYITSAKREQHIDPIYKELKKFGGSLWNFGNDISTQNPDEISSAIQKKVIERNDNYSLILIVGRVGSGKSTFIRYFKRKFLEFNHPDLSKRCEWLFINMNDAPLANDEIYNWIKRRIIQTIKDNNKSIEFDSLEIIEKIFSIELNQFENGLGKLLADSPNNYKYERYKVLDGLLKNDEMYLSSMIRYVKGHLHRIPIIVLDNSDKRNRDEQLLMFSVAQWLKSNYNCMLILPMRDITYDTYKNEPPLDTVVRDLVFSIDAPDLLRVLQERLQYIARVKNGTHKYSVGTNMSVVLTQDDLIQYFRAIMVAIRNTNFVKEIIYKLSNNNIRAGLQIFVDFCRSGHVDPIEFLQIYLNADGKDYKFPINMFMNALLRKNRLYYNGDKSNIINVFASQYEDDFPDPLSRIDILLWLKMKKNVLGIRKIKGLFQCGEMIRDLQSAGHNPEIIQRELYYMVKKGLIYTESESDIINPDDLIIINQTGLLHIKLVEDFNISYLSACAEDFYYCDQKIMLDIANKMKYKAYLKIKEAIQTTYDFINYLINYRTQYIQNAPTFLDCPAFDLFNPAVLNEKLMVYFEKNPSFKQTFDTENLFRKGNSSLVKVVVIKPNSLICVLEMTQIKCYLSTTPRKHNLSHEVFSTIKEGDMLLCKSIGFNYEHGSYDIEFISKQ
ncbi:MAG TPA: type I restriction endonuclease [Bacilli bacterium]|nr:type I restriction endonuclease [Bacilli bacterium]